MRKPHAIRAIERNLRQSEARRRALGPTDTRPHDWAMAVAFLVALVAIAFLVGALTA